MGLGNKSWLPSLIAAQHFYMSLNLSFLICKVSLSLRVKCDNVCKVLHIGLV